MWPDRYFATFHVDRPETLAQFADHSRLDRGGSATRGGRCESGLKKCTDYPARGYCRLFRDVNTCSSKYPTAITTDFSRTETKTD